MTCATAFSVLLVGLGCADGLIGASELTVNDVDDEFEEVELGFTSGIVIFVLFLETVWVFVGTIRGKDVVESVE